MNLEKLDPQADAALIGEHKSSGPANYWFLRDKHIHSYKACTVPFYPGGPQIEKILYEISNLQHFSSFIARFQDFKTKKLRNIRNKMLSIRRSTGTFASKDFRKWNRLKPYENFWCSVQDTEYTEVYVKYMEFYSNFSDFKISRFQISTRFQRACMRLQRSCGPLSFISFHEKSPYLGSFPSWVSPTAATGCISFILAMNISVFVAVHFF